MIDFAAVQNSVKELKSQLAARKIDEKSFEDQLLELITIAEDGHYWMYGHESEKWFRHDGYKWVSDNPNRIIALRKERKNAASNSPGAHNFELEKFSVSWSWFAVSLLILIGIGWIVYFSSIG